jgi:hypothetical protein
MQEQKYRAKKIQINNVKNKYENITQNNANQKCIKCRRTPKK